MSLQLSKILEYIPFLKKDFIYVFLEKGERRKRGRETSVGCLSQVDPDEPATQARALTGSCTGDLSLCRTEPQGQGWSMFLIVRDKNTILV